MSAGEGQKREEKKKSPAHLGRRRLASMHGADARELQDIFLCMRSHLDIAGQEIRKQFQDTFL